MRAVVIERFGGPEVLELRDIDRPVGEADTVLVRVIAAGANPVDAKIRAGGAWAGVTLPAVLGYEASGVVEEVGDCALDFDVGDEVYFLAPIFGNRRGTYAEYTSVLASLVAPKPETLAHDEAAAIPLAGGTAWEAVGRRLRIRPGETVLIHGGAGGVGSFAVQMAKIAGARVLATAGPHNQRTLRDLGVDVPIDYEEDEFVEVALSETGGDGVDATFDTVGGGLVAASIPATRAFGRLATILAPQGDLSGLYTRNQTLHGVFVTPDRSRLVEMRPLFERGLVRPLIHQALPLDAVRAAHERLDAGHGRGKIVLKVA